MSKSLDDVETIKHPTDYVECVSEFFQNSSSQQELYPPSVVCESERVSVRSRSLVGRPTREVGFVSPRPESSLLRAMVISQRELDSFPSKQ